MNALTSWLRHVIVTGILLAVEKLQLPIEGADAAADVIALFIVGTLSWWFVKYVGPKIKPSRLPLILVTGVWVGLALMGLSSCSVSLGPDGKPRWTVDSDAVARAIADRINEQGGQVIVSDK